MTQVRSLNAIKRLLKPAVSPRNPVSVSPVEPEAPAFCLRPYLESDLKPLAARITSDAGSLFQWLPIPDGCTSSEDIARVWIERGLAGDADGKAWRRLAVAPNGSILGGVNLLRIERGLDWQADVNWWVASTARGRGLATKIVKACLEHAFGDLPNGLGLHQVHAGIQEQHPASRRVAEKCGFVPASNLDSRLLIAGAWQMHRGFIASA